ncbi:hypothetical protein evm_000271 [Chilo suppressalis]|nr:hypothetical protein evm_000271 [Chilo suppressalis]
MSLPLIILSFCEYIISFQILYNDKITGYNFHYNYLTDSRGRRLLFFFIVVRVYLRGLLKVRGQYQNYHDVNDHSSHSDKVKMIKVAEELVKDAHMKVRQVAAIRDDHAHEEPFQIGLVMGNIREKYRRMLETYREFRDKNNGRSFFVPASIWELSPIHYIIAMEQVHALETDIDKLVHVLENIVSETLNPDPRYVQTTVASGKRYPRAKVEDIDEDEDLKAKEEALKRKYREEHLLRRLTAASGHTPRPRFQQQWPVEDTWRLGQYGDLASYYTP